MSKRVLFTALLCLAPTSASAGSWATRAVGGMDTRVYVPDAARVVGAGRGLLVLLHGCTQTNDAFVRRGNLAPAAEAWGMVVAAPQVPNGGVLFGCWDYYGANHSRTTRHARYILDLVRALLDDASLGIDPQQVYVAGLSSGAGQAAVMGCLAPDVFAGVGVNAGPAVGTSESQASVVGSTAAQAETVCRRLAGGAEAQLATQVASIIAGSSDFVVAQGYADVNAQMYAALQGASATADLDVRGLEGYQPAGQGRTWADARGPRVSRIIVQGMGHAFPAGSGDGFEQEFIASKGPAWPAYLGRFFAEHNPRLGAGPAPDGGVPVDAGLGVDGGAAGADAGAAPGVDGGIAADGGPGLVPGPGPETSGGCQGAGAPGEAAGVLALGAALLLSRGRRRAGARRR
jgi:poly(3-hydroxybutyrate) depolymerase